MKWQEFEPSLLFFFDRGSKILVMIDSNFEPLDTSSSWEVVQTHPQYVGNGQMSSVPPKAKSHPIGGIAVALSGWDSERCERRKPEKQELIINSKFKIIEAVPIAIATDVRAKERRRSVSLRLLTNFHHKKSFSDLFVFNRFESYESYWRQLLIQVIPNWCDNVDAKCAVSSSYLEL